MPAEWRAPFKPFVSTIHHAVVSTIHPALLLFLFFFLPRDLGNAQALAAGIFHRKEVAISEVKDHLAEKGVPARRAA